MNELIQQEKNTTDSIDKFIIIEIKNVDETFKELQN